MDVPHQQFHVTKFTTRWYLDKSFCIYGWLIKRRDEDLATRDDGVITLSGKVLNINAICY